MCCSFPFLRFLLTSMEASPTDWFIRLLPSNQLYLLRLNNSLCEWSFRWAVNTDSSQFCNFLSYRQQINNISECFPLECAIKCSHHNNDTHISKIFTELYDIIVELSLINSYDIVLCGSLFNLWKAGSLQGFHCLTKNNERVTDHGLTLLTRLSTCYHAYSL